MDDLSDVFVLRNGIGVPCVGFGTFELPPGRTAEQSAAAALQAGWRHIDTAMIYRNEADVARALEKSGLARESVFLTTKLWNTDRGYDAAMRAFERSLKALRTDYIDLYLIHWPAKRTEDDQTWRQINSDTWRALEDLYMEGSVHAIGVSNFRPHHLEALEASIDPMVNQIQFQPGLMQKETVQYCRDHDILVEAWGPLASGKLLKSALLTDIAGVYGRTVPQIVVRWCLQHDILPLIRSRDPAHIESNGKIFDFAISPQDMHRIDAMMGVSGAGVDPDKVNF